MSWSALKVRPAATGAVFAVCAFAVCALADRAEGFFRSASAARSAHTLQKGDLVEFSLDRLTYEVIGADGPTALIQRGEDQIYVHRAEIERVR